MLALIILIPNALVFFYLGLIHQRGPLDVVHALRTSVQRSNEPSVLFLTPCHSTPLYSHLHLNIAVKFLTCEPNLRNVQNYRDEADIFFADPLVWINEEYLHKTGNRAENGEILPSHIIMYDTLADTLDNFLSAYNYTLEDVVFNSHFYDRNRGSHFHIYARS